MDDVCLTTPAGGGDLRPKFAPGDAFQRTLRQRVEARVNASGLLRRDCPRMYLKIGVILGAFVLSYCLLVFVAHSWWQALPLGLVLALATAGIGFDIQHDGGHKAVSDHAWINKLAAMSLDLVGGSSYVWRWKHVVFHHMYVNIHGHDTDIELGIFGRLCPAQPRYAIYRWQQWYLWPLYGVVTVKWHFYDDYRDVILGRMGANRFPRPRGWDLVEFVGGKLVFMALALGIPLLFHPLWAVLLGYGLVSWVVGLLLSEVFQLAHTVEEADFPAPEANSGRIGKP
jgi:linoleoyl-CoA desaturase